MLLALPTPSIPAGTGRVVAVTAVGGVLSAAAVVGTQVAGGSATEVAQAGSTTNAGNVAGTAAAPSATVDTPRRAADTTTSRDVARTSLTAAKQRTLAKSAGVAKSEKSEKSKVITKAAEIVDSDPRDIARAMLSEYGWSESEFSCLDALWVGESNWRVDADNPTSSAYGIPQALPGSKMASAGADWETNPTTQIKWGLTYISSQYGDPCSAEAFKQGNGWY